MDLYSCICDLVILFVFQVERVVDGLGRSNLIEVIRLMKCGGLTREEVEKNLLCFGAYGTFVF